MSTEDTLDEDRPCGCAQVGPLLTAPGTSGRNWYCQSCGKVWMGAKEALAEARKEWAQGASCFCGLTLVHELREFCITDRANEIQRAANAEDWRGMAVAYNRALRALELIAAPVGHQEGPR